MKIINNLFLEIDTGVNGYTYDIHLDGIKTDKQKKEWIEHLKQKNWFTKKMEVEFINLIKTIH